MRNARALRCLDGGSEEIRVLVIGGTRSVTRDRQKAVLQEQRLARLRLELAPDLVGAACELRVLGTFAAGEARDARLAMAGAEAVRRSKPVDAEHALPRFGELIERGRAHRAEADHDRVVTYGHDGSSEIVKGSNCSGAGLYGKRDRFS